MSARSRTRTASGPSRRSASTGTRPRRKIKNTSFGPGDVSIKWFEDGVTNVAYNCIDRHLPKRANQTAIIWEGDDPKDDKHVTYQELHDEVCRMANILRNRNVEKGDRVTIYMPMIPEAAYAMLACARIGAIHSVVFGGFSPDSLAGRIEDCKSTVVITADEGLRGGRKVPLKANVDAAIAKVGGVDHVIVVHRTGAKVDMDPVRDVYYDDAAKVVTSECPCEHMNAEDPLFILYTSGSTGKPKGVLHTTAGYNLFAAMTHQLVFDYHDGDIYWCTADVGWVTGHSYILYGPLSNGATTLMFEGVPNYPSMLSIVSGLSVRIGPTPVIVKTPLVARTVKPLSASRRSWYAPSREVAGQDEGACSRCERTGRDLGAADVIHSRSLWLQRPPGTIQSNQWNWVLRVRSIGR